MNNITFEHVIKWSKLNKMHLITLYWNTVEPFVSELPPDIKAGAGRLQESKNTEFVWESRKMGFC